MSSQIYSTCSLSQKLAWYVFGLILKKNKLVKNNQPLCTDNPWLVLSDMTQSLYSDMSSVCMYIFKRPARDACLCMGDLQAPAAPPAPHFVFLITL